MASENINDHELMDLLDLSNSEVEEWIPDTDEEWGVTDEEDDHEPNHQERSHAPDHATDPDVRRLADIGPTTLMPTFEPVRELASNFQFYTPGRT
ncbi:hypothetical protein PoB_005673500 [Plakobranchus ocellatus]|uniref:Uncharacterized protein n=1 Tax=Plakobranchus ocellatus TaxID=259542 RepID=A0AAV4CET9_9GAST|nr:hypothetical protein PoB_005673500 [Plakobranchus ocellatus]